MPVLFLTAAAALIYGFWSSGKTIDYTRIIKQNIPDVIAVERVGGTQPAYRISASGGMYYAVCDSAIGYQSRIEVMTIVSCEGLVEKVLVTRQGETPVFFQRLYSQAWFDEFKGLSVKEPIFLGEAYGYSGYLAGRETNNFIDRVTGSTVSSHAVTWAVNNGAAYLSKQFFNRGWNNPYEEFQFSLKSFLLPAIYAGALAGALNRKLARLRIWILLAGAGLLGFYANQFVTANNLFSLLTLQIPRLTNLGWYLLIFGSLAFIAFLGKNLYCAWICPFGAVQELLNKAAGFRPLGISPEVADKLRLAAPVLLWLAVMLGTCYSDYRTLDYQPFSAFFLLKAVWVMWLLLPVLVFMNLFISRFYCRFFCPVGFTLNLLNRWRNGVVRVWRQIKNKRADQVKSG